MTTISRTIDLLIDKDTLFAFLTDSAAIATIFNATGAMVKPEQGGTFEINFPKGDSTKGCKILTINPTNELKVEWVGPSIHRPFGFMRNTVSFLLEEKANGVTLTLNHGPFEEGADWEDARLYYEENWDQWLHNLSVMASTAAGGDDQELPTEMLTLVAGGRGGWQRFASTRSFSNKLQPKFSLNSLKLKPYPAPADTLGVGGRSIGTIADCC